MAWKIGVRQVDITPPVGVWMTGFAGRPTPAIGVHDLLYAKAIVFETNGKKAALVSTDILGLTFKQVEKIRNLANQWTEIDIDYIMINSSHTHSGPETGNLRGVGFVDEIYLDVMAQKIATAIKLANDNLKPAKLCFGKETVRIGINRREKSGIGLWRYLNLLQVRIGINRRKKQSDGRVILGRNPDGPRDDTVYILRCDDEYGAYIGVVFSYVAHPVVLGPKNLLFSADYPGYATSTIMQAYGDNLLVMFLQGCCGNINSDVAGGTFEDARRLGTILGTATIKAVENAQPIQGEEILAYRKTVPLPLQDPPKVEDAEMQVAKIKEEIEKNRKKGDAIQIKISEAYLEWANLILQLSKEGKKERFQPLEIQVLRLGDLAFVGTSAETFIQFALNIKSHSPFSNTVVLGYTNGCIGYLPTADAYPEGGYEIDDAIKFYGSLMLAPKSEKITTDTAVKLLNKAFSDKL